MVHGPRKAMVKARLWARILGLATRAYGSPVRAWQVLWRMVREREKAQPWVTQKYASASGRYFWSLYAPGFPSRAFDAYIERELNRVEAFRDAPAGFQSVVLAMTRRCALRCEHCCEWDVLNAAEALSLGQLRDIVQRVQAQGTGQLFLSGGEPLRRFNDLIEVVRLASREADVWVLTSGHGLTPERARRLHEAGLTGVALSLDHWDPDAHDRFRGHDGVFEAVRDASDAARSNGLLVALSICPTREFVTADNLERYAALAALLGASFIQVFEPKAVGHYAGMDVALPPDARAMLEAFADRLNADPACRDLPGVSYQDYASRRLGCRGAGDRHLYIDTGGVLHPCPFCRSGTGHALEGDFGARIAELQSSGCHLPAGT